MGFNVQQFRLIAITAGALLALFFFLHRITEIQEKHDSSLQTRLNESLQILWELKTLAIGQKDIKKCEIPPPAEKSKDEFTVAERGFWQGLGATKGHAFDAPLAKELLSFFQKENVTTILELGAGMGIYAKEFKAAGLFINCYDGNPETQEISEGRCAVVDLSKRLDFTRHDWTLSLEVGEHIPKEFEDVFISNLVNSNVHGLILSWAIEGQGGTAHVNNRNNSYVKEKIEGFGYTSDLEVEKVLRAAANFGWFKNTIMVFRKNG